MCFYDCLLNNFLNYFFGLGVFLFLCVMIDLNFVNKFRVVYVKFIYYMYLIIE